MTVDFPLSVLRERPTSSKRKNVGKLVFSSFLVLYLNLRRKGEIDSLLKKLEIIQKGTSPLIHIPRELLCKFDFYYYLCSCGLVKAFVTCRRYNSSISDNNNVTAFAFVDKKPL